MARLAESRSASGVQAAPASVPAVSAVQPQHRVAWLIGEVDYPTDSGFKPLPKAVKDAEEVGKLLADSCGFETSIVPNASKAVLECFSKSLFVQSLKGQNDSVFLLYFAGHGYSCNGQPYLVPTDGRSDDPKSWMNLHDLIRPLHDSVGGAQGPMERAAKLCFAKPAPRCLVLVVLDSCRELPKGEVRKDCEIEPLTGAKVYQPVDTQLCIFCACDDGKKAKESEDAQHGLFTQAFIEALKVPDLSWAEIWTKCRTECLTASRGTQRPWRLDTSTRADKLVLHSASRTGRAEVVGMEMAQEADVGEQPTEPWSAGEPARTMLGAERLSWGSSFFFSRIPWRGLFRVIVFLAVFDLAWLCADNVFVAEQKIEEGRAGFPVEHPARPRRRTGPIPSTSYVTRAELLEFLDRVNSDNTADSTSDCTCAMNLYCSKGPVSDGAWLEWDTRERNRARQENVRNLRKFRDDVDLGFREVLDLCASTTTETCALNAMKRQIRQNSSSFSKQLNWTDTFFGASGMTSFRLGVLNYSAFCNVEFSWTTSERPGITFSQMVAVPPIRNAFALSAAAAPWSDADLPSSVLP